MEEKRIEGRVLARSIVMVLLIFMGIGLIGWTFREFQKDFLKNADDQLYQLARAVDRNMESHLQKFDTNLAYIIEKKGFSDLEEKYREKGCLLHCIDNTRLCCATGRGNCLLPLVF
jgi:hypothetical protein